MPGLIESFSGAELAYRQERIRAEFNRPKLQPWRWLGGVLSPSRRRAGRAPLPGPARPAPHHLHAAS
jgi:hypothetical protein